MLFDKLSAYFKAMRVLGTPNWEGCPFIPKSLVTDCPPFRQEYNRLIASVADLKLDKPTMIWDVGANHGRVAQSFSALYPDAEVYLFEPLPRLHDKLEQRARRHGGKWHVEPYALGDFSGEAEFSISENMDAVGSLAGFSDAYQSAVPSVGQTSTITTRVRTADEVRREKGISHIDLLKVDVEGFEFEFFEGARETLPVTTALMVEVSAIRREQADDSCLTRFLKLLDTYGFRLIEILPSFPQPDGSPAEYNAVARRWS